VFSECSVEKCCHALAMMKNWTLLSEKKARTVRADEGEVPHQDDRARTGSH
jgi:hypothetical protein